MTDPSSCVGRRPFAAVCDGAVSKSKARVGIVRHSEEVEDRSFASICRLPSRASSSQAQGLSEDILPPLPTADTVTTSTAQRRLLSNRQRRSTRSALVAAGRSCDLQRSFIHSHASLHPSQTKETCGSNERFQNALNTPSEILRRQQHSPTPSHFSFIDGTSSSLFSVDKLARPEFHDASKWTCTACQKIFQDKSDLQRHMKAQHLRVNTAIDTHIRVASGFHHAPDSGIDSRHSHDMILKLELAKSASPRR
ncbi:hypothetical protein BXZ70DRAFT_12010 [Cristinia sonorae]|uniref:C2H2-type domain-containing protein n=1 Tax=Cristinia sonorae TaxID=1940300 RepID=A0A8K0V1E2_9AGAR|nr:hypothetical protein BXZ70DRAFT_12010 [Cristinia sonorae]